MVEILFVTAVGSSCIGRLVKLLAWLIVLIVKLVGRILLVVSGIVLESDHLARRSKCVFGKVVFGYFFPFGLANFFEIDRG